MRITVEVTQDELEKDWFNEDHLKAHVVDRLDSSLKPLAFIVYVKLVDEVEV